MKRSLLLCVCALAFLVVRADADPLGPNPVQSAFTYQGELDDGGSPADGLYDFEFHDARKITLLK